MLRSFTSCTKKWHGSECFYFGDLRDDEVTDRILTESDAFIPILTSTSSICRYTVRNEYCKNMPAVCIPFWVPILPVMS